MSKEEIEKKRACSRCEFHHAEHIPRGVVAESNWIECRAHPPHVKEGWPAVAKDDWCGEFALSEEDALEDLRKHWEKMDRNGFPGEEST